MSTRGACAADSARLSTQSPAIVQPRTGIPPVAVLFIAVLAVAHGAIFVRLAAAPPLATAAWRLTLASAVMVPIALLFARDTLLRIDRRVLVLGVAAGGLLAGHFATWITSLSYTSISNSVVLVTSVPVWVALIGILTRTLRPSPMMWVAIALSVAGAVVIGSGSVRLGGETLKGDLLAVAGAIFLAGYLLLARRVQRELAFLPYAALAYASTALWLWLAVLVSGTRAIGFGARTWAAFVGIALVSQVIGHSGYNWALRHLRPDFVSVTLLGEPILASVFGLLFFHEAIPRTTLLGGILVLTAIVLAARSSARAS